MGGDQLGRDVRGAGEFGPKLVDGRLLAPRMQASRAQLAGENRREGAGRGEACRERYPLRAGCAKHSLQPHREAAQAQGQEGQEQSEGRVLEAVRLPLVEREDHDHAEYTEHADEGEAPRGTEHRDHTEEREREDAVEIAEAISTRERAVQAFEQRRGETLAAGRELDLSADDLHDTLFRSNEAMATHAEAAVIIAGVRVSGISEGFIFRKKKKEDLLIVSILKLIKKRWIGNFIKNGMMLQK